MSYQIIDLGGAMQDLPSQNRLDPYGINNRPPAGIELGKWPPDPNKPLPLPMLGNVVGATKNNTLSGPSIYTPFFWSNDSGDADLSASLPSVTGWNSAYAINDSGTIVGVWNGGATGQHAVMWDDQFQLTGLDPLLSSVTSEAYDINKSGKIVGRAKFSANGKHRAFLYDSQASSVTQIDPPSDNMHSFGFAVNRPGQVVGELGQVGQGQKFGEGGNHAFFWSGPNGQIVELFSRDEVSSALDINDTETIVGMHYREQRGSAFIRWPNGNIFYPVGPYVDFGPFRSTAVNNNYEVIGGAVIPAWSAPGYTERYQYAWIYNRRIYGSDPVIQTGSVEDLNNLIPANSGWHLIEAFDINEFGQIVGKGKFQGEDRPFLLDPIRVTDDRKDTFVKAVDLVVRVIGGVASDGGGFEITPGGGFGPVDPMGPLREVLNPRMREEITLSAIQAALAMTDDEALKKTLQDLLSKGQKHK